MQSLNYKKNIESHTRARAKQNKNLYFNDLCLGFMEMLIIRGIDLSKERQVPVALSLTHWTVTS